MTQRLSAIAIVVLLVSASDRSLAQTCRATTSTGVWLAPDNAPPASDFSQVQYRNNYAPPLQRQTIVDVLPADAGDYDFPQYDVSWEDAFRGYVYANATHILYVNIDEPYLYPPTGLRLRTDLTRTKQMLEQQAQFLHALGLRVWVNFSYAELDVMKQGNDLNSTSFDRIAYDSYHDVKANNLTTATDVHAWFVTYYQQPLLEPLMSLRKQVLWGGIIQWQEVNLITDGFVAQSGNATEIANVVQLWQEYNAWAYSKNSSSVGTSSGLNLPIKHTVAFWSGVGIGPPGLVDEPALASAWTNFMAEPVCFASCSNTWVDMSKDRLNCGSCGNVCPNPANGAGYCSSSTCQILCDTGYTLSNGQCVGSPPFDCSVCECGCNANQTACKSTVCTASQTRACGRQGLDCVCGYCI